MATLGANLRALDPSVTPLSTEELTSLTSYKLLNSAFFFRHVYLPDDDLAVFVTYFVRMLDISPEIALPLVFIVFGVSELKFRTESGMDMGMSAMCEYIHEKLPEMLPLVENIPVHRFSLLPRERFNNPVELIKCQIDPAKSVLYSLTRFSVAKTQLNDQIYKKELCEVYKVPATLAVKTLPTNPTQEQVSLTVGWGLLSLWLVGEADCPDQPYWFSDTFREVLAKNMQEELKCVPALQDGQFFPPTFFTEISAHLPLLIHGASSLKEGLRFGGLGRRSRSHTPTGDGSAPPGSPIRDGFITPGDENEQPEARAIRALENFLGAAQKRCAAWNGISSEAQALIRDLRQNELALGCDFIPFD